MRTMKQRVVSVATLAVLAASPAWGQQPAGLMGDLLRDVSQVEKKLVGLARAMPEGKMTWRPGEKVRSVGEVFLHLASDNYLLPALVGVAAPAKTGIDPKDFGTLAKYEKQALGKDAIVKEMEESFAHLATSMRGMPDSRLEEKVKVFGQDMTVRQLWILTVTHLHEHLGQSIAYARSNDVVPPWSK